MGVQFNSIDGKILRNGNKNNETRDDVNDDKNSPDCVEHSGSRILIIYIEKCDLSEVI